VAAKCRVAAMFAICPPLATDGHRRASALARRPGGGRLIAPRALAGLWGREAVGVERLEERW
jgi:hypothetical protein